MLKSTRILIFAAFTTFEIVVKGANNASISVARGFMYGDTKALTFFLEDYSEFRFLKRLEIVTEFSVTDRMWVWPLRLRTSLTSVKSLPPGGALGDLALALVRTAGPMPPLLVLVYPSPELLLQLETLERRVFKKLSVLVLLRQANFPRLSLPLDNLVTFAMVSSSNDNNVKSISLVEQYSVAVGYPSSTFTVGTWTQSSGVVPESPGEAGKRTDLQGLTLRCLYISGPLGEIEAWSYRFTEALEYHLNFTCRYQRSKDYGAVRKDGSWTGMVGDLASGKGDLTIVNLDNTLTRSQVVHFLVANEMTGTVMIMKKITSLDSSWSRYTSEFSSGVWWSLMATVSAMTLVHHVVVRNSFSERQQLTMQESFMEVIGAFGSQSSVRTYSSSASRATLLVIFGSAFLVVAHYSSWLAAMLTVQTTSYPFHGFQSVLDDNSYVVGVIDGWATKTELECSNDQLLQKVWTQLVQDKGVVGSLDEGLQRALNEKLILLVGKQSFILDQNFDKDQFSILPGVYFLWPSGFTTVKDSPYIEILNKGLLRLRMNGVLQKLRRDRLKSFLIGSNTDSVAGVTLEQTMSLFSLLAIACVLSLLILVLEILANRCAAGDQNVSLRGINWQN